jgi:hypothetical protein
MGLVKFTPFRKHFFGADCDRWLHRLIKQAGIAGANHGDRFR